jgi:DNA-binding response OmpR family regulator
MAKLIAIVDDEQDILELVSLHLKRAGYETETFSEAAAFYRFLEKQTPSLLILDLMLPDEDGLEVCKKLRRDTRCNGMPILMLTARSEETDTIIGLELGADDYVKKPFSPKELVARVKALLRRGESQSDSKTISIGSEVLMDLEKYTVHVNGESVALTPTEFRILRILAERKEMVFSRDQILEKLWGNEKAVIDRTIDVHIKHIREKLGDAAHYVKNLRGIGYKVEE